MRVPPEVQCILPSLPPESCCRPCAPVAPILLHPFLFPGPSTPTSASGSIICLGSPKQTVPVPHAMPMCISWLCYSVLPMNVNCPSVSQWRGEFVLEERWLTRRVGFLNQSMGVVLRVVAEAAKSHSPADARQLQFHVLRSRL